MIFLFFVFFNMYLCRIKLFENRQFQSSYNFFRNHEKSERLRLTTRGCRKSVRRVCIAYERRESDTRTGYYYICYLFVLSFRRLRCSRPPFWSLLCIHSYIPHRSLWLIYSSFIIIYKLLHCCNIIKTCLWKLRLL